MSYLFNYGKTPAALLLAQLLDEVGDDREKHFVSKSMHFFSADLKELLKIAPTTAIRAMQLLYSEYKSIAEKRLNNKLLTVYLNVILTKYKIAHKTKLEEKHLNREKHDKRSKSFNTPEMNLKSRIMNSQDKLNKDYLNPNA